MRGSRRDGRTTAAGRVDVAGAAVLRDVYTSAGSAHVAVTFVGVQPLVGSVLAIVGLPAPIGG